MWEGASAPTLFAQITAISSKCVGPAGPPAINSALATLPNLSLR
ncbi:DUF6053 domain-containing protein [Lysobacter capsici]